MRTFAAIAVLTLAFSATAQTTHNFVFTGQAEESFPLTGLVGRNYIGTCYDRESGSYPECDYNSSGEYTCRTVSWGSLTPYSCETYGFFPGTGAQVTSLNTVRFTSTLKNPNVALVATLDQAERETTISAQGLLPAGVVLGARGGTQIESADETLTSSSSVILTTNADLQKNFVTAVRRASLDVKHKRLTVRLAGRVRSIDKLSLTIRTGGGLFRSARDVLSVSGTLGALNRPSAVRTIGLTETEIEVDLNGVLADDVPRGVKLTLIQTQVLDPAYTWTGVIGGLEKTLESSLQVRR